jgi:hypothetical protein
LDVPVKAVFWVAAIAGDVLSRRATRVITSIDKY